VDVEVGADMVEEKLEEEEEEEAEEEEKAEQEEKDDENSSDKIQQPSPGRWGKNTKERCHPSNASALHKKNGCPRILEKTGGVS